MAVKFSKQSQQNKVGANRTQMELNKTKETQQDKTIQIVFVA